MVLPVKSCEMIDIFKSALQAGKLWWSNMIWTKIVWKPHIFPFWTSGLIVFDKVWTPTNIWWNIVKIVYVWKVIKHVWYRFTTPYKRCLILYGDLFKWFRVLEIYLAKSWFYFADFTLQLYWFCYNSKFIWRKTRFLFSPICRSWQLLWFCYTSKYIWRKTRFLFCSICRPLQL